MPKSSGDVARSQEGIFAAVACKAKIAKGISQKDSTVIAGRIRQDQASGVLADAKTLKELEAAYWGLSRNDLEASK